MSQDCQALNLQGSSIGVLCVVDSKMNAKDIQGYLYLHKFKFYLDPDPSPHSLPTPTARILSCHAWGQPHLQEIDPSLQTVSMMMTYLRTWLGAISSDLKEAPGFCSSLPAEIYKISGNRV